MKPVALLVVSLSACAASPPARVVLPRRSSEARVHEPVREAPPFETCGAFAERMRVAVARWQTAHPDPEWGAASSLPIVGFCSGTRRGVWRIEMLPPPGELPQPFIRVAHVGPHGRVVHDVRGNGCDASPVVSTPVSFDWDGDGEPELYVAARSQDEEGCDEKQAEILTFRDGAIVPFAPARGLQVGGIDDVDHDGRPDLLIFDGYDDRLTACGSGFSYDHPPPRFAAHALAGGAFSLDDDAAKAYARTWCPAPPAAITDSATALCARLWVQRPADVARETRRVAASCTQVSCDRANANLPQPPKAAGDCDRRQAWFARRPPLSL